MENYLRITLRNVNSVNGVRPIDMAYQFRDEKGSTKKKTLDDKGQVSVSDVDAKIKKMPVELNKDNAYSFEFNMGKEGLDVPAIKEFIKGHIELGTPTENMSSDYIYSFDDDVVNNQYEEDEQKMEVFSAYKVLERDQQNAIAVYFGVEPWGVEESELRNRLVGLNNGVITTSKESRADFLNNLDRIFDAKVLNFQSAVLCGVISMPHPEVYSLNSEVLGSSREAAIANIQQRPELYAVIERELKRVNKFVYTKSEKEAEVKAANKAKAVKEEALELENAGVPSPKRRG